MRDVDFNEILSERNVRYDAVNLFISLQTIVSDDSQCTIDSFILMPMQYDGSYHIKYIDYEKPMFLSHILSLTCIKLRFIHRR